MPPLPAVPEEECSLSLHAASTAQAQPALRPKISAAFANDFTISPPRGWTR
jgi:hypothetical protein